MSRTLWYAGFWGTFPCELVRDEGEMKVVRFRDGKQQIILGSEIHESEEEARKAHGRAIMASTRELS